VRGLFIYVAILFFFCDCLQAQKKKPWRKRAKMAAEHQAAGEFYEAARYYKSILKDKPDKLEYAYQAGVCFLEYRDYQNAVKYFALVKDDNETYDKPGFKYALALKQTGQPQKAKEAFDAFLINYQGAEKELYKELVDNEIKGCNYALKAQEYTDPNVSIEHINDIINTKQTEFAPIPFDNDILYFSTTIKGVAKIHRTQKKNGLWQKPRIPKIFIGNMQKPHFGNGTFTADGQRFYFTQCDVEGQPQCAIYVMEQVDGEWSDPKLLPDFINPAYANTTHPFVVTTPDQEVLYFSTNRKGGRGGLDLWYTTRPRKGGSFTLPQNLGRNINTQGDEISPFYHNRTGTLYFSSNGRVSAGGLDIFKSKGRKLKWEVAQNLGFPVNSSADDLYYTISESHGGGYIVSNRPALPNRKRTTDDDIFYFAKENVAIEISGQIATIDNTPIEAVNVKLFEMTEGEEVLLQDLVTEEDAYSFSLEPRKYYLLSFAKKGFQVASFPLTTASISEEVTNNIQLKKEVLQKETPDWENIRYALLPAKYNSNENSYQLPQEPINPQTGVRYTGDTLLVYNELNSVATLADEHRLYYDEQGNPQPYRAPVVAAENNTDEDESEPNKIYEEVYEETLTTEEDVVYKIQVAAVRKFRAYKYEELKKVGRLAMESIDGGVRRVLIVDKEDHSEVEEGFRSKGKALNVLSYILNNTRFKYAFVIKYVNGQRTGEGFRGWEEDGLNNEVEPNRKHQSKDKYEGF